jgi:hypothetical protein
VCPGARSPPYRRLKALSEKLLKNQPDESNLMKVIDILRAEAKGDGAKLQADLEAWFNGQMDRVTGSYKRWAKRLAILIALVVAFSFNIDTVAIARSLYTDGAVRSAVLDVAASGNVCPPATTGAPASPDCLNTTIASQRAQASRRLVETTVRGGQGHGHLAGRHEAVRTAAHHGSGITRRPILVRSAQPAGLAPQRRYQASQDVLMCRDRMRALST